GLLRQGADPEFDPDYARRLQGGAELLGRPSDVGADDDQAAPALPGDGGGGEERLGLDPGPDPDEAGGRAEEDAPAPALGLEEHVDEDFQVAVGGGVDHHGRSPGERLEPPADRRRAFPAQEVDA